MATGRIGVTPTLGTRWSKAPAGGTTSLSGLDDNSVALVYSVGYEQVYRNGVLLSRGNDYTATSGNSITLTDATIAGDIIEVFANELVPLTDAISKGQFTAKGALLSATAASTPAVLTVGSNDQVLTADSSTATGLKWATPAAGGMTLISTTTLSGATTTVSSIPTTYNSLVAFIYGVNPASNSQRFRCAPNGTTNISQNLGNTSSTWTAENGVYIGLTPDPAGGWGMKSADTNNFFTLQIDNYASSTNYKSFISYGTFYEDDSVYRATISGGGIATTTAITSLVFSMASGNLNGGTVVLYGVK